MFIFQGEGQNSKGALCSSGVKGKAVYELVKPCFAKQNAITNVLFPASHVFFWNGKLRL